MNTHPKGRIVIFYISHRFFTKEGLQRSKSHKEFMEEKEKSEITAANTDTNQDETIIVVEKPEKKSGKQSIMLTQ